MVRRAPALRYDPASRRLACIGKPCAGTFTAYREAKLDFSDIEPLATVELAGAKARTVTRQLSVSLPLDSYLENKLKKMDEDRETLLFLPLWASSV